MTIAVTGAAGFIGSHVAEALATTDRARVLPVDSLRNGDLRNIAALPNEGLVTPGRFVRGVERGTMGPLDGIVHLGAVTDTLCDDQRLLARNNVEYSVRLARAAQRHGIPLVYASSASVYGVRTGCREEPGCEEPLNGYAASKLLVDNTLRPLMSETSGSSAALVGLRFFNVYGTREDHKGAMASVVTRAVREVQQGQPVRLFAGCPDAPGGTITRDWVSVVDVVAVVRHLLFGPRRAGVFNVGTGQATTFEHIVSVVLDTMGRGAIEAIPFPPNLRGRYQYATVADLRALRHAGYEAPFAAPEVAVPAVVRTLMDQASDHG